MNKYFKYFLILFTFFSFSLIAQDKEVINQKFTNGSQFLFNEFQQGEIYFKDGGISSADLNYNVFFQEILFMKEGQSLVLTMLDKIDSIKFEPFNFIVLNKEIFESIINTDDYIIAKARKIDIGSASNTKGAYGSSTETSATEEWKYMVEKAVGVTRYPNTHDENDREFKLITRYYLIKNGEKSLLSRKKLMKIFPDKSDQIKKYIKENKISLSDDKDILNLFNNVIN